MGQSAAELARRMMKGDNQAFDRIMEYYYLKMLCMAYLTSGSYVDSEDIAQGTFVSCWTNRRKVKGPGSFGSWIYRTLIREAWRFCRKHRKEQPVEAVYEEEEPQSGSALEEVMKRSRDQELYRAVRNLPAKQRTAVVLYYFNRISAKKIVQIIGCLEGTVKSRLYMTRENLKKELTREQNTGREVTLRMDNKVLIGRLGWKCRSAGPFYTGQSP